MTHPDLKHALALAAQGLNAFTLVADAARVLIAKDSPINTVYAFLHAIVAAANTLDKGIAGEVSVESVENEIGKMRDTITANDIAADTAIDLKFPK